MAIDVAPEYRRLIDSYFQWLRDRTALQEVGEWLEVTTPHLDRHNDHVQIYVKRDGDRVLLTDDGYTLSDLEGSGCNLESAKRQSLLRTTLAGFGVTLSNKRLVIEATPEDFPRKKHNLLQAIIAVNDLFYLASPFVVSLFYEEVLAWLNESDIRFVQNAKFTGKSGFDYLFNFVIPKSKSEPERLVQAITNPNKETATKFITMWFDTKDVRPPDSKAIALLNDSIKPIPSAVNEALERYEILPVPWREREQIRERLAA